MVNGEGGCLMCSAIGWGGMILGALLIVSALSALLALTVYLLRRSRTYSKPSRVNRHLLDPSFIKLAVLINIQLRTYTPWGMSSH